MESQAPSHETCCKIPTTTCPCPICGNAGRKVTALTLDNHVPGLLRAKIGDDVTFCLNPACDVVYCNPSGVVVRRGETILPVTIKDGGDDVNVCYCFDFRRRDLRADLEARGKTDIPAQIRKGIAEGRCDCERKNPQGACCLGNVAAAIKKIEMEVRSHGKRRVEVFAAGCPVCDKTVKLVKSLACPECVVVVYDLNRGCETGECRQKAEALGIERVPAVAVDGKLVECCKAGAVDAGALRAAGVGRA